MSWDVNVVIDTGGKYPATVEEVRNLTYNNSELLTSLQLHPIQASSALCSDWVAPIQGAIFTLAKRRAEFEPLEPENGWGGIDDVTDFLTRLLSACLRHPKAQVSWT